MSRHRRTHTTKLLNEDNPPIERACKNNSHRLRSRRTGYDAIPRLTITVSRTIHTRRLNPLHKGICRTYSIRRHTTIITTRRSRHGIDLNNHQVTRHNTAGKRTRLSRTRSITYLRLDKRRRSMNRNEDPGERENNQAGDGKRNLLSPFHVPHSG
jgi:hypothetical protein